MDRSLRYLAGLSEADLSRKLNEPRYQPLPTVGVRLVSVMSDNLQHASQVAYLRDSINGVTIELVEKQSGSEDKL